MPKTKKKFSDPSRATGLGYQAFTSGKKGTADGRYAGARSGATQVNADGTKSASYGGKVISRQRRYKDVRIALGLDPS